MSYTEGSLHSCTNVCTFVTDGVRAGVTYVSTLYVREYMTMWCKYFVRVVVRASAA